MPICSDPSQPAEGVGAYERLHIGLVNNMPTSALEATERQFRTLLGAASEGLLVRLSLYALPEIPRSDKDHFHARYINMGDLLNSRLDGLIVTGTEPLAPILSDESYWGSLTRLVEWAEHNTFSSIWSCLAGHAAVLQMDGIKRRPLGEKRFGIFECTKAADHSPAPELTAGLPDRWWVPHSRWHDVPGDALEACGYDVLTRSEDAGVDAFIKRQKSLFVFFQGHPEYEAESLWLEYRRDMRRFLRRESEWCPSVPQGCLDGQIAALSSGWRERALSDRCEAALANFPFELRAARVRNTWRPAAIRLYRNWLLYLCARKASGKDRPIRRQFDPILGRRNAANLMLGTRESGGDNLSENGGWSADQHN